MDPFELKKEQLKLAPKVELRDGFTTIRTIGGAEVMQAGNSLLCAVVVCEFPSMKLLEYKRYLLSDPLPYRPGFEAYREMPAIIEAYNQLEQEPDVLLVKGAGVNHPQRFGIASHLGLVLNHPTIGVDDKCLWGKVEKGKIILESEIVGFEITTREFSNPIYAAPGHLISLGSALNIILQSVQPPHKMPEPLHLARKMARKR